MQIWCNVLCGLPLIFNVSYTCFYKVKELTEENLQNSCRSQAFPKVSVNPFCFCVAVLFCPEKKKEERV